MNDARQALVSRPIRLVRRREEEAFCLSRRREDFDVFLSGRGRVRIGIRGRAAWVVVLGVAPGVRAGL